jgi:hypothetical protein
MFGFGLTYVFATTAIILSVFFVSRLRKVSQNSKELLPFAGFAILSLVTAIANIITSWFDYYVWEQGQFILELWEAYASMQIVVILAIVFVMEYVSKKTKYLVSLYLFLGLFPNLFIHNYELENLILIIVGLPAIALLIPLYYLTFLKSTKGPLRKRLIIAFLGIMFIIFANLMRSSSIESSLGTENFLIVYCIGTMVMIAGIILVGFGFSGFSTFTDIMWKEKLRELYVITGNGNCLYAYSFDKKEKINDNELVGSGLMGIQAMLGEMVKTKENLHHIEYKNLIILLEQRNNLSSILVLNAQSSFLQFKLKEFLDMFSEFFEDTLKIENPNSILFSPTKGLIEKSFLK